MTAHQIKRRIWQRISKPFYKLQDVDREIMLCNTEDMLYDYHLQHNYSMKYSHLIRNHKVGGM